MIYCSKIKKVPHTGKQHVGKSNFDQPILKLVSQWKKSSVNMIADGWLFYPENCDYHWDRNQLET